MTEIKKRRSPKTRTSAEIAADPELSEKISSMIASLNDFPNPTLVIGDGWAAMASVGFLATKATPENILWILNSGARAMPPLPFLESGVAVDTWKQLAHRLGVTSDEPQTGQYLREFRNRSFSRAAWHKSPTPEMRFETRMEWLWAPETRIAPIFEARFDLSLGELEEKIREKIATLPNVRVLSDVPVTGFEPAAEDSHPKVVIASGAKISFTHGIWADRWIGLGAIEGLPKNTGLARNREPVGILQAVFTHSAAMVQQSMNEAFFTSTHKDAGEEFSRSVWGHFFDGGKKSVWTLFLTEEEGLDNHTIGKKYRRLKQALEKMFTGPEWLPEGAENFSATVTSEHFAFQEDFLFSSGDAVTEPQYLGEKKGSKKEKAAAQEALPLAFVTDAFGPSVAMEQVAKLFAAELGIPVDLPNITPYTPAPMNSAEEGGAETQDENVNGSSDSGEES
ncbi:MAG: hypothetical protein H7301_13920 [Cryobacterium sp.]|nr:hypothetical protein [Oligoflexia bacterium]